MNPAAPKLGTSSACAVMGRRLDDPHPHREAIVQMNEPVSPYLKQPLRTLDEALDQVESSYGLAEVILAALDEARAKGMNCSRQFQAAVDKVLLHCPELTEPVAVSIVDRVLKRTDG